MPAEHLHAGKCRVKHLDIEPLLSKMGAYIEDAQGNVGLEDLHLLRILVEKISVSE
jgi:hypothetical protein